MSRPVRAAFVMEQALGHATHYRNVRALVSEQTTVQPTWLPIAFEGRGNWSVRASWRARRALSNQQHDVLFFHTQVTALFSAALMRKVPAIVSLDATPINYDSVGGPYGHEPAGHGLLDAQKYRMNRQVFHSARRLVSWSEWARRSLVHDYGVPGDKVHVLPPGAASEFFAIGERRQTPQPGRPVRLLFVGGDFVRKGGVVLLDSLPARCELHIVSRGPVPSRPNVHVHTELTANSPELLRLFAEADIFVLPTLADCLPVVLAEAAAAGLAVVTTDVGAVAEAVVPGESGLVVPVADAYALNAALTALVRDAELRERMGRAGHALARRKFDARRNTRALLDLVEEVAA